jgi:hypothetical protein
MYDWQDDFVIQACLSFPSLRYYIAQCADLGDIDQAIELMFGLVARTESTH